VAVVVARSIQRNRQHLQNHQDDMERFNKLHVVFGMPSTTGSRLWLTHSAKESFFVLIPSVLVFDVRCPFSGSCLRAASNSSYELIRIRSFFFFHFF
jgi:hypothetical protein